MTPQHWMNLYQKPRIGNQAVARIPAFNYKHRLSAMGWFDTASFEVAVTAGRARQFLDQYIGNRVAIFVDRWPEPIWEGFIHRMSFNSAGTEYSISLEKMANQLVIMYHNPGIAGTNPQVTTGANNAASILVYGVKRESIDMGSQNGGTSVATGINAYRDTELARRAWPKSSTRQGGQGSLVKIECKGFKDVLTWDTYRDSATTSVTLDTFIKTHLLPAMQNGSTFFSATDFTEIATNALTINRFKQREVTFWDLLSEVCEIGNASNYYVAGITPTNPMTSTRRMYYRAANFNTEYYARQSEGLLVRTPYGRVVPPWYVRPDRVVKVSDALVGWDGQGDDPTTTYIQAVEYDGNQQTARWIGDDNTTAEGVMQIAKFGKATNTRFGARRFN